MCGLAGLINRKGAPISDVSIRKMAQAVRRRGPDGEGYFHGPNFALGHQRLAIIDLSAQAGQPMTAHGATIIFNGEIYNYIEIRKTLEQKGYVFRTASDTEVILAAYDHWGSACLQQFNGMWAFVLYDPRREMLFCARDRFGIKPLYYTSIGDFFCLASEIKQFEEVSGWRPRLNKLRAYEFLAFGWQEHTAETFFEGVQALPAGHYMEYQLNSHKFSIHSYYQLEKQIGEYRGSFQEAAAEFRAIFEDSIRLRLRADVPTGATLSGGLDSSSIAGVVSTSHPGASFATVSACFEGPDYDERPFIEAVARRHGLASHKVFPTYEQWLENMSALAWHQGEPVASASVFAQYMVFRNAREQGLKVMLDGQGADEILCGYEKFYLPVLRGQWRQHPLSFFRLLLGIVQHHEAPLAPLAGKLGRYMAPRQMAGPVQGLFRPGFVPPPEALFQRSADKDTRHTAINLIREIGLPVLLRYLDRNSMAHSVESRLPFLDYRLVEFCLSLPDDYKVSPRGIRKYVQREAMRGVLPTEVFRRYDKMGFAAPQAEWARRGRERIVQDIMAGRQGALSAVLKDVQPERYFRLPEEVLWRVWCFLVWGERFLVNG